MRPLLYLLMLAVCAVQAVGGPASDRLVLLSVRQNDNAWSDNRLFERMQTVLTREPGWRVEPVQVLRGSKDPSGCWPGVDSMVSLGRDLGGQYLVCLVVFEQRLERRKSFHVPLVFHKWESVGVMKGEFRVIDLLRGKQVKAEPFEVEMHGPRVIQATMDDTKFDPDITMTATDKALLFENLEEQLVDEIVPKIKPVIAKGEREQLARQDTQKRP
jgi:hypothetical protein